MSLLASAVGVKVGAIVAGKDPASRISVRRR